MDQVTFALPRVSEGDMDKTAQYKLIKAQAISVIVSQYLDYAVEMYRMNEHNIWQITPTELKGLIDSLQNALD